MKTKYDSVKVQIRKQLNVVIFNEKTLKMLQNADFLKEVVKNISALKAIEEFSSIDKKDMFCYKYMDRINTQIPNKQTFIEFSLPEEPLELLDDIKFMNSLAINLFGLGLDEIKAIAEKNDGVLPFATATTTENNEASNNASQAKNTQNTTNNNQSNGNSYDYGNPGDYKEVMISQMAVQRFNREVSEGKIYLYDYKPKAVPFIKYAVSAFFLGIALSYLALIIFMIFAASSTYSVQWEDDAPINLLQINPIDIIFLGLYAFIYLLMALSNVKNMKNDNFKYKMGTFFISFVSIISLFQLISNIDELKPSAPPEGYTEVVLTGKNLYLSRLAFSSVLTFLPMGGIIFLIPYIAVKPKVNVKLRMELINQYKDEIRAQNKF